MALVMRRRAAVDVAARVLAGAGAAGAAASLAATLVVVLVTYIAIIPPIQDTLAPRFDPAPTVDTGEVLLSFTRTGLLAAFAALAPPVLRWDGAGDAGARTFAPSADFSASATPTTYDLALVPGPLAGQTCPYAASVTWDARGFAAACTSSPPPGTPFGAATLDVGGTVPFAQLPPILYVGPAFLGYWNAASNTPFLTNASCGAGDKFYYVVSDAGSTQLGPHTDWAPLDQAACFNGTWGHVAPAAVDSVFGRIGAVVAEYADYSSTLVEHAGAPLADTLNASFVVLGANAGLPNAAALAVAAGELTLVGATLGMPAVAAFPLANNTVGGYPKNPVVDRQGRWVYTDVGVPIETIAGAPGQIAATCVGHACALALPQDIATNSTPAFAGVAVGTDLIVPANPSSNNLFNLPSNAGAAGDVYTRTATGAEWRQPGLEYAFGANGILVTASNTTTDTIAMDPNGNFTAHSASLQRLVLGGVSYTSAIASVSAVGPLVATANTSSAVTLAISPNPAFATVVIGGTTIAGSGGGTVTAPAITGAMVVTAGAQTVGGAKTFTSTLVTAADVGVQLDNAGDTFSTTLRAGTGLAQNLVLRMPVTNGAAGNALVGDGAGNLAYATNGAALAKFYATALASVSGATFVSLYAAGTGSLTIPANTLAANTGIRAVLACSHVSGVGTSTYRVVLGGTTLVTSSALANVASTPMHIEVTAWVPSAGTILVSGTIVRGAAISVFTQPSPVVFNPAIANAFDMQVSFSSSVTASCRGFMRVGADLF